MAPALRSSARHRETEREDGQNFSLTNGIVDMVADEMEMVKAALPAKMRVSKLPSSLRFPLVVVLSLTSSSLAYSLCAQWMPEGREELGRVARRLDGWDELGGLLGWRAFELALGWFGNYDGYDLAALTLLSHGPPLYLLGTFYEVSAKTILSSLIIDTLTTYIPFRLLRRLSPAHAAAPSVPNRDIVNDLPVQVITTLLAASIYSVTLYSAYLSYLPLYLVTYFNNIPTIVAAHSSTPTTLFPVTLLLGLATRSFIFTPATTTNPADSKPVPFDPESATLGETIWWNLWGWSKKTKIVIKRTATLMLVTGVNTFVQTYVTVEGVEAIGALAYSAVWVVAAVICGGALGAVGAV